MSRMHKRGQCEICQQDREGRKTCRQAARASLQGRRNQAGRSRVAGQGTARKAGKEVRQGTACRHIGRQTGRQARRWMSGWMISCPNSCNRFLCKGFSLYEKVF